MLAKMGEWNILEERILDGISFNKVSKIQDSESSTKPKNETLNLDEDTISTTENIDIRNFTRAGYTNHTLPEMVSSVEYNSNQEDKNYLPLTASKPLYQDEEEYKASKPADATESEALTPQQAEEIIESYKYSLLAGTFASEIGSAEMHKLWFFYKFDPVMAKLYEQEHIHSQEYSIRLQ
jgi:hypothetical protein